MDSHRLPEGYSIGSAPARWKDNTMTARHVLGILLGVTAAQASTFYCDPIHGSPQGDGSSARPWGTIEQILQERLIQLRDRAGQPANPEAPVKPGDTVLLRSGWHGIIRVAEGYNDQFITVEKNVVGVNHWHGITLGDAQACSILDNVCFSRWSGRARPWVQLGQKKNQAAGNTVRNNFAHTFDFRADAAVHAEHNQEVTEAVFNKRLVELARDIDQRFGERHPTAKRLRLESAPRTSLSDPTLRFTPSSKPYIVLRCGPLTAVVVDNQAVDDDVLPGHRAGYSGLGALRHDRQSRNLFVPAYAGLNLEHILDGTQQERAVLFEPRNAPMELRVIDERTAELYQPPTPHYGVESCQRFQLFENGLIELTFECIPRAETWRHGYLHFFWASYIDRPESLDIHFLGRPETDAAAPPTWVRGVTPRHGELSTHRAFDDDRQFAHVEPFPLELPFSFSRYRYAEPWYFGLCRGMAFAQLFRSRDEVRIAQSPSGGGNGCPAWDFQWFIERPQVGQRYQLVMRAVYAPVPQEPDEAHVRAHVRRRAEEARQTAAPPGAASGF